MLTLSFNHKSMAPTQLYDMPFNSMTMFNGVPLAASASGIHKMCDCDSAEVVNAFLETPLTDFGVTNQKRLRRVYLSGEFYGTTMKVITKDKEDNERPYTAASDTSTEESIFANIGRDGKGRHWSLRVENVNGADFSIDSISVIPVILNRRR